ncbi:MAG TPA: DUF1376 domain-containing protein [Opitutales bacterium]|jgi:uncharacterized protein YdaU (DUF1376 family)|nr:DUF1376 domain-containing protein [Opitutales bacterium]
MNKPPAFQFYVDDFLGGTIDMSAQEVGAYIRLLCYEWGRESIPDDRKTCDRIAGCKVTDLVLSKFPGGKNPRLEKVRDEQNEFRQAMTSRGRSGAEARWHKQCLSNAQALPKQCQTDAKPMPKNGSPVSSLQSPVSIHKDHKASSKRHAPSFSPEQAALTARFHAALGVGWENDRQKWMGRIKRDGTKCERVVAEVECAAKEGRIKTTAAQYAEQTWVEFE